VAAELVSQVPARMAELRLVPVTGGRFEVEVGDETVFDVRAERRVPPAQELADLVKARL
jgi:predicted Rdx family selenoprotein